MEPPRLYQLLGKFRSVRVAVIGDFFLDKLLHLDPTQVERSENSGRAVHQVVEISSIPSAAGTVVSNLASLGAGRIHVLGVIGDDGEGYELCQSMRRLECATDGLLRCKTCRTPAVIRPLDVSTDGWTGRHPRYDIRLRDSLPERIIDRLLQLVREVLSQVDVLIIMDQATSPEVGVITKRVREALCEEVKRHPQVTFWADSRRNIRQFRGVIIKPNEFEAVGRARPLAGDQVRLTDLKAALPKLRAEVEAPVFITFADRGMLVSDPVGQIVPGLKLQGPIDPTGAGDTATAGMALAMAVGATPAETALVGNLVAAVTVRQLGSAGIAHPEQVVQALEQWGDQQARMAIELDTLQDLTEIDVN